MSKTKKKQIKQINKKVKYFQFYLDENNKIQRKIAPRNFKSFQETAVEFKNVIIKARERLVEKMLQEKALNLRSQAESAKLLSDFDKMIFKELDEEHRDFFRESFFATAGSAKQAAYKDILKSAYKDKKITPNLTKLDKDITELILNETFNDISLRTQYVANNVKRFIRSTAVDAFADASLTGESYFDIYNKLLDKYLSKEFYFIDNGGKKWTAERYAEMITRTKLRDIQNNIYMMDLSQVGTDLIVIDNNGEYTCPSCTSYENKILSISGKTAGFETVAEATNKPGSHLFGPNCDCTTHMFDDLGYSLDFDISLSKVHTIAREQKTEADTINVLFAKYGNQVA
jgi:hypothetical protein